MAKKKPKKNISEPVLQFSVLCDAVGKDPKGKLILAGVFSLITKPSVVPQFFMVNRYIYGEGTFKEVVKIKSPDLAKDVVSIEEHEVKLSTELDTFDTVIGFVNVNFDNPGVYWIEIYLNDNLVRGYPLAVGD